MSIRSIIIYGTLVIIVAFSALCANAQKTAPPAGTAKSPAKPAQAAPAAAKPADKSAVSTTGKNPKAPATPAEKVADKQADTVPPQPILLELRPGKDIYHAYEDMFVKAELWAIKPVTLCVYPEHPEANFAVELYRGGAGKLYVPPKVVQLNHQDLQKIDHINLEAGQMHRVVFNLKKLVTMPPLFWKTGEYRVQVKFFLCGKTEQAEQEIPSQGPLHLLVIE